MAHRLVRRLEFQARLGVGRSTFFALRRQGVIPDPDARIGRRRTAPGLWLEETVERTIRDMVSRNYAAA